MIFKGAIFDKRAFFVRIKTFLIKDISCLKFDTQENNGHVEIHIPMIYVLYFVLRSQLVSCLF